MQFYFYPEEEWVLADVNGDDQQGEVKKIEPDVKDVTSVTELQELWLRFKEEKNKNAIQEQALSSTDRVGQSSL